LYNVKIVETEKEHADAFAVRKKVFVEEQGVPLHLECDAFDATATHFIMYEDNEPAGAARLRNIEDHTAKIERVCILQSQRGKKTRCFNNEGNGKLCGFDRPAKIKTSCAKLCSSFLRKARVYGDISRIYGCWHTASSNQPQGAGQRAQ